MQKPLEILIPPVVTEVDGAKVEILEVIKLRHVDGSVDYHVACRVHWRGMTSRVFFVDVKDIKDFKRKIGVEIAKMKMFYMVGGKKYVDSVVRG